MQFAAFLSKMVFSTMNTHLLFKTFERKKGGNCLGLCLLIGGVLLERGFSLNFSIITRPKDAIDQKENELFQKLLTGGLLDYDRPSLPEHQADHPIFRFGPLEHPVITIDGKPFETTGLEDVDESPEWTPDAELSRSVTYRNLSGTILSEQAKRYICKTETDCRHVIDLSWKSIELWPENADAYFTLWVNARAIGEDTVAKHAAEKYLQFGQGTSNALWGEYCITQNPNLLTEALKQYPAFLFPFIEKHVTLEPDPREARFNFAVAAWCAGNSSVISLRNFYNEYRTELEKHFGIDTAKKLLK